MRSLLPLVTNEVDPAEVYAGDARTPVPGRPWVVANMVASIDGAVTVDGRSGGLGGPADRLVFSAIRAVADVIVVGAATVRAEGYGPPRTSPEQQRRRVARGQQPFPRIAVVTSSLEVNATSALFTEAPEPTIVITTRQADPDRLAALAGVATVIQAGDARVDVDEALRSLGADGVKVVLTEGGPTLLAQLAKADLLDELCLTVAPLLVGGAAGRILGDADGAAVRAMHLDRILEADGELFLRYVRDRAASDSA